ncbi:MAG: asparagine synthase-related protein [Woeseiales bacterium]
MIGPFNRNTFMTLCEAVHCWIERMEKISAAVGLECLFPFESNDILQFALEMPDELRNLGKTSKPILRSLAADLFDREVAYGEKKQLAAPMSLWLDKSEQLRDAVLNLRTGQPHSRTPQHGGWGSLPRSLRNRGRLERISRRADIQNAHI